MKKLVFTCVGAAMAVASYGGVISPEGAALRLRGTAAECRVADASLFTTFYSADGRPECYVMNGPAGFMVLAADDAAEALIGYGDHPLAADEPLPAPLEYMLQYFAGDAEAAHYAAARDFAPIAPMLRSKWNQDSPYNADCPTVSRKKCPTGCTATAMAQVLRYHAWPERGVGEYSYTFGGNTYSFDYENNPFDYSLMLDSYAGAATDEQKQAVARLMYACGVAAEMQYNPSQSGAYLTSALRGLADLLRYNPSAFVADRDNYTAAEWERSLHGVLSACGPVIYCGYTQGHDGQIQEGHTFVVDGYSSDGYFHINWGWGGEGDGYFLLGALDTYGNGTDATLSSYSYMQQAIFDLTPLRDPADARPHLSLSLMGPFMVELDGNAATWTASYSNDSAVDLTGIHPAMMLMAEDGSVLCLTGESTGFDLAVRGRKQDVSAKVEIPADLKPGSYNAMPGFKCAEGGDEVLAVTCRRGDGLMLEVSADGSLAFVRSEMQGAMPEVKDLKLNTCICSDRAFGATFTVEASPEQEFAGAVTLVLLSDASDATSVVAAAEHITLNLQAGEELAVDYVGTMPAVATGSYYLAVATAERRGWGEPMSYTLLSQPIAAEVTEPATEAFALEAGDFSFAVSKANVADEGGVITVKFHAECTQGYKVPQFYMDFYPKGSNSAIGSVFTTAMPFSAGTQRDVTITTTLSKVEVGGEYFCRLMAYDNGYSTIVPRIDFTVDEIPAGVEEVSTAEVVSAEYYDLAGRRIAEPERGIYVCLTRLSDGTLRTEKVALP